MHNLELRICNWILVSASMFLSGLFGWFIMRGETPYAYVMFGVCAVASFLVSAMVQRASINWRERNRFGFVLASIMAGIAILFNVISDYSSASILRDRVMTAVENDNVLADNARAEVERLEKAIANLRGETAWRTKYESPETYDALIMEQKQRTDRGRNIFQRTKECTDTTLEISEQVCREIARLEAQKANAQRRQVILSELKTLGEQLATAKEEVGQFQKVSNPALAQVRSITTWVTLDRDTDDRTDWWGSKSIMLYMTMLLTALIVFLGWELGQTRPMVVIEPAPPAPRRNRWLEPPDEHRPIPLEATDAPPSPNRPQPGTSSNSTTVVYSNTKSGHDHAAIQRLLRELEEDFGLTPKH